MNSNITQEQLLQAKETLTNLVHKTPVLSSEVIDKKVGADLYFKCENFQKTGSFKFRGASYAVSRLGSDQKKNGVTTHSSGNHGQALAKAAQLAGIRAYIVMPENAPTVKKQAVKGYGAEVIICESTQAAREKTCRDIQEKTGATFTPPYDHENIVIGQSTASQELFEQTDNLDYLLAPVGGGGLLSGALLAAKFFSPTTKVIGSEPLGADDAYRSIKAGKRLPQENPQTIADGLRTSLGEINFEIISENIDQILTAKEDTIIEALKMMHHHLKIMAEPSCALPLATILENKSMFEGKKVGIIISGGNVDLDVYYESLK
ncbi:threonine/serine dehydratase [Salibacter halophilus]|uniref:Threonine/serine dehydratase n=2 Tax=Salibacter halophilus TaxID=1803916 RepID=A0A6N6MAJ7_9FLAO|nr:threonine/serine dehydratase [Salibacter halophilus]